mgnify:FL=1|jgi:hypothetical protein|tara:strand:+ start:165 stop:713 length:549 start_codon:yes stop_codon:yes gene_type:complete
MSIITLKNVRLSFPQIWTAKAFNKGQDAKFNANFLLDKDSDKDQIESLRKEIKQAATAKFNGDIPKNIKMFLGDGEDKAYDGYENAMFVSASCKNRPTIIDRDRTPLVEEDGRPFAGCYVNAAISIWIMDNDYGKRINANLVAIQFVKDGESFGSGPIKADNIFDDISSESAADAETDDFLS